MLRSSESITHLCLDIDPSSCCEELCMQGDGQVYKERTSEKMSKIPDLCHSFVFVSWPCLFKARSADSEWVEWGCIGAGVSLAHTDSSIVAMIILDPWWKAIWAEVYHSWRSRGGGQLDKSQGKASPSWYTSEDCCKIKFLEVIPA